MKASVSEIARELIREHEIGMDFRPFAASCAIADLETAYAVQAGFVDLTCQKTGAVRAGYKIGLTSARMQAMCGIDSPVAGVVLSNRIHPSGKILRMSDYGRLGLEFEIGVRMAQDLPAGDAPFSMAAVAVAVEAIAPAFELVDDRHAEYGALDLLSLVADNSWNAGVVLGDFHIPSPSLEALEGVVICNGEIVDRGAGRDVLGHPFAPLVWLANYLAGAGRGLRAGDIIVTGTLAPTRFAAVGERYRFELSGLGAVEVEIAP